MLHIVIMVLALRVLVEASEYTSSAFLQCVHVAQCYLLISKISPSLFPFLLSCLLATDSPGSSVFFHQSIRKSRSMPNVGEVLRHEFVLEASMEHV